MSYTSRTTGVTWFDCRFKRFGTQVIREGTNEGATTDNNILGLAARGCDTRQLSHRDCGVQMWVECHGNPEPCEHH
jgi:hypothetical protein